MKNILLIFALFVPFFGYSETYSGSMTPEEAQVGWGHICTISTSGLYDVGFFSSGSNELAINNQRFGYEQQYPNTLYLQVYLNAGDTLQALCAWGTVDWSVSLSYAGTNCPFTPECVFCDFPDCDVCLTHNINHTHVDPECPFTEDCVPITCPYCDLDYCATHSPHQCPDDPANKPCPQKPDCHVCGYDLGNGVLCDVCTTHNPTHNHDVPEPDPECPALPDCNICGFDLGEGVTCLKCTTHEPHNHDDVPGGGGGAGGGSFGALSNKFSTLIGTIKDKLIPDLASLTTIQNAPEFVFEYTIDMDSFCSLVIPVRVDFGSDTGFFVAFREFRDIIRNVMKFFLALGFSLAILKLLNLGG